MFFQETAPDTSGYMIAGYAIAFVILAMYAASLHIRNRNLRRDVTMLEDMEKPAAEIKPRPKNTAYPKKSRRNPVRKQ